MDATWQEIVLKDRLTEEGVTLFWTIAVEPFACSHLVGGSVHCLDDSRCQRLCDVADAEGDDICLGVHHLESIHLLGDVGEQVVVL